MLPRRIAPPRHPIRKRQGHRQSQPLSRHGRGRELRSSGRVRGVRSLNPPPRKPPRRLRSRPALVPPAPPPQLQIGVGPAQPALGQQHRHIRRHRADPALCRCNQHVRQPRFERDPRDLPAMRRNPTLAVDRSQPLQPGPRLGQRCRGGGIEERQPRRIGLAPHQARQQQPRKVGLSDFGRVMLGQRRGRGFLPQAQRDPRPLPRRASRALGRRGAADALGRQSRQPRAAIVSWPPREPAVDDDRDVLQRHAGLRDARRQHQFARSRRRCSKRGALRPRLDPAMQPVKYDVGGERSQRLGGPLDLGDPRQECEQRSVMLGQRLSTCRRHRALDPLARIPPEIAQRQRMAPPFAPHQRRTTEQPREPLAIHRRRHRQDPQIRPQRPRRIERQRQREIIVEAAFVDLVEQHRRHAGKFGIGLQPRQEHAVGHRDHPRRRTDLAVEPRLVTDRRAGHLAALPCHIFRCRPRRQPPRHQQQHLAHAPRLTNQRRRHHRRLPRPRRRNQQRAFALTQRRQQLGQDGMDRKRRGRPGSWPHHRILPSALCPDISRTTPWSACGGRRCARAIEWRGPHRHRSPASSARFSP